MTAIWHRGAAGWSLLEPVGFPDEAALHALVGEAPEVLPLAGSPRLVVLGSEVRIGSGSADLVAIESTGRIAIIEVKLARNAEARRAVVAQILTYAAYLKGTSREAFEDLLRPHLTRRGSAGIYDAVSQGTQDGSVDPDRFLSATEESLATGAFRLVLVLDQAPPELVQLVGYLESVAPQLTIDLVTVSNYLVDGSTILVPQRVDPERMEAIPAARGAASSAGYLADGGEEFRNAAASASDPLRSALMRHYAWAKQLESDGLASLRSYRGSGVVTLLPYPVGYNAGLITLASDGSIWTWRSVFEKRAPDAIELVERALNAPLKQGGVIRESDDELLRAIRAAYEEARARTLGSA